MITIIDYGMGNLGSIHNMFKRIGAESEITSDLNKISLAKKLLLPGVGSFDKAMSVIESSGLKKLLNTKVIDQNIPLLGICLGMQLLTNKSEEGTLNGFGWISAQTVKFRFDNNNFKIPHMGWNVVSMNRSDILIKNLPCDPRFYFVHSYYVKVDNETDSLLKTNYGGIEFDSAINRGNIWGTQFHPEKSHKFGMRLLENFAKIIC